jgi:outer membrane protein TolC
VSRRTVARLWAAVLVLLTLVRGGVSAAQEGPVLTPEALRESVTRSFPLLKAAELEEAIAGSDVLSAEGGFDLSWKTRASVTPVAYYDSFRVDSTLEKPTALWGATGFVGYRLGTGKFPVYYGNLETLDYGELRAGVSVPLWRNGPIDRRRANLQKAETGQAVAKLSVTQQRIEVQRAAGLRYWAWVAAGKRLAIAEDLLAIAQGRDGGLAERVARGDLPNIERTDNLRALEQRKAQQAIARRGLEQASLELSLYLRDARGGRIVPGPERLPKDFPEIPGDASAGTPDDFTSARARRPEVRRLDALTQQNQVELRFAKNQMALGLDLQLVGSQDFGPQNPRRPDLQKPVFEVSLLLDVPLQTRMMQGRADASAATIRRLAFQKQFFEDRIDTDVRDAHSALRAAKTRLEATRREVALAKDLEESERVRFQQGDSHLLIVNLREQQTAEAELREVDAVFDWYRAQTELRAARGDF